MPKAAFFVFLIWCYTLPWAVFPYLSVWGRFVPGKSIKCPNFIYTIQLHFMLKFIDISEGFLTTCTFDYLSDSFDNKLFVVVLFIFSYCIPMLLIIYYYSQICKHVFNHEKALRVQAKKMNIESLRTTTSSTTAEVRIARAAITICFLFVAGRIFCQFIDTFIVFSLYIYSSLLRLLLLLLLIVIELG